MQDKLGLAYDLRTYGAEHLWQNTIKRGLHLMIILLYSGQNRICDRFLNLVVEFLIDARDQPN